MFLAQNLRHPAVSSLAICAAPVLPQVPNDGIHRGTRIELWSEGVPGFAERRTIREVSEDYWTRNVNDPSVHYYAADRARATGAAVLIIPGGAHEFLVTTSEGHDVARWFAERGVAAFVLYYRLAREEGAPWDFEDSRQDADRAMRLIRGLSNTFQIDPAKVGVMGFSAGGQLARWSLLSPLAPIEGTGDRLDTGDARPDFGLLVFPGPLAMPGEAISPETPPILLSTAADDECCAQPTIDLFLDLRAGGAPAELHVYQEGGHAYNMGENTPLVSLQNWPSTIEDWMVDRGFMRAR